MNLLLFEAGELNEAGRARIGGRRAKHIREILKAAPGASVRAGVIGGALGEATVEEILGEKMQLRFEAKAPPPAPLPVQVFVALPRPKALRRLLANVTTMGVKEIWLMNAYRVEKSYWHSEYLSEPAIRAACVLGLEQARDTVLPRVHFERRFKPFVEDRLPAHVAGRPAYVAHPGGANTPSKGPCALAIGPEGGFIPYEIELLKKAGFSDISIGARILKCETALTYLLGKLT